MTTTDPYWVLGLPSGATQREVRSSYRRLARKFHPDANPDDPRAQERFKEVQQAYAMLSVPSKRRAYDGFGSPARAEEPIRRPARGEDVTVRVGLEFKEVLHDVTTRVAVPVDEPCPRCGVQATAAAKACSECGGVGRVRRSRPVTVKIPAGARDGLKLRVPGRGSPGTDGGPPGDLYVVTSVTEHPVFERHGNDFLVDVPVSFVEAATGAEIEVPSPTGRMVKLKLPAGTQDGRRLRVRGAGVPKPRSGGFGDLVVRARVTVPKRLTRRQRELLDAFAEEHNEDVRAELLRRSREP